MSIQTSFLVTWQEYYAAQQFLRRERGEIAPEKIAGTVLTLTGLVIWMFGGHALFVVAGIIAGLTAFIGIPIFRRAELRQRWQRQRLLQTQHDVSFSEAGIHYVQGHIESNLNWSYYQRLVESSHEFLLVCGEDVFNLIPKRAFDSEQSVSSFRHLVGKKLGKQ